VINTKDGTRVHGAADISIQAEALGIPESDAVRARAAYAQLPDIRLDKVMEIRRRMDAGLYNTSAEDLAEAILCSAANAFLCH
jgi:anti-sigma28 factor (negative regulator of flagellin synthesis)